MINRMSVRTYASEWLEMDRFDALVSYKNMRYMRMRVKAPYGHIAVSVPLGTPDLVVVNFLLEKEDWIRRNQAEVRLRSPLLEPLVSGGRVPLWGLSRETVVEVATRASARLVDGQVHIRCPENDEQGAQRAVDALYRREMGPAVARALDRWEPRVGRKSTGVKLKRMKARWGSCNTVSGEITLNTKLAKFPTEVFEYVVVHELVHLLERGHGPAFKAHMTSLIPGWPAHREALSHAPC